jgi:hypothetical protein
VAEIELLPEIEEERGDLCDKFGRLDSAFLGGLLDLLSVLIHASEEEDITPCKPLVACYGIGENFLIGMADVRRAIRVVNRSGDEKCIGHGMSGIGFDFSAPGEDARLGSWQPRLP